MLANVWSMAVFQERDALRGHLHGSIQRIAECLHRLLGKPVKQVEINPFEAMPRLQQVFYHLRRLDAVNRFLHMDIEILHTERDAIDAIIGIEVQIFLRHRARVYLHRHFFQVTKRGNQLQFLRKLRELVPVKMRRRSTTQMNVLYKWHIGRIEFDFPQ